MTMDADKLLEVALEDYMLRQSILTMLLRDSLFPSVADCDRLVRAAVFGRVT